MSHHRLHARTLVCSTAVAVAAVLAQTALAGPINGDPKNEWPFTRPTVSVQAQPLASAHRITRMSLGDVRLRARTASQSSPVLNADPKDEWPFTRSVDAQSRPLALGSGGFSWRDSGVGFAAGIGIALSAAALMLARKHRAPRTV